jgi:mannonate dehydratase
VSSVTVTDVRAIPTAPAGHPLVIVKVETSEPGLYGLGCATFNRHRATVVTVEEYLRPFLLGKDVQRVEEVFQSAMARWYWRNGPEFNNALSGVDMALWDIKAKLAGMPVYELLGGKCREAAAAYGHVHGQTPEAVAEQVVELRESGFRHVRCQLGGYGTDTNVSPHSPDGALPGDYYDPAQHARGVVRMLEHVREAVGFDVELLHDVHERLAPPQALWLAKAVEPVQLFFLEDPLAPEQADWFPTLRHTTTPIAMGELFVNPREWMPLVAHHLIDFTRAHVSCLGGITPARKMAAYCELHSVRTAWHGPPNCSPVGHAANLHLDLACPNFGIQESYLFPEPMRDVFPGCPEVRDGYIYPNERPGLGIDMDEKLAAKYPCTEVDRAVLRWPDGTAVRW